MLFLSTMYYAWMAYQLAKQPGRTDVCALPSGVSVPHMFVVVFVIMLPIKLTTGDPVKGWEAGLAWVFLQGCLLMVGGFIAPFIRKLTPRAALLGTLAGVSVAFISMRPALEMFMTPVIGLTCFAIILASWFGNVRYYKGIPAGLVAIAAGTLIAWGSTAFGFNIGGMSSAALAESVTNFGFSLPMPAFDHTFSGFEFLGFILVTAIPFGIYDLVEAMDNVESAAVAGDSFPTTRVLSADGVISTIGCLMGNPFNLAVYIGHPGWKAMGGRIGYSAATGLMVLILAWTGIIPVIVCLVPVVAISPILLYIGMLIGAQAFQETPRSHAPAIMLAMIPHVAAWGKVQIDNVLGAAGTSAAEVGLDKLAQVGVLYEGLVVLGGGSILGGLVLGAMGAFIVDRKFEKAAAFALAGAVLTFLGFMHGEAIGFAVSPLVASGYAMVAALLFACAKLGAVPEPVEQEEIEHEHPKSPAFASHGVPDGSPVPAE
jgi:AGZA family xanthine/uracil permease-like MFS transporter